jgi:OCT family organic cation transporter-like MFS transporter 4/5
VCCSYITFAVGVVADMIALLLVCPALDRYGRHNLLAFGQLLGGGACVGAALISGGGITQAVLAGIGKFGCSGRVDVHE